MNVSENDGWPRPQPRDRSLQLLDTLAGWLEQGQRAWLATVTHSYHHSLNPQGSLLAVSEQGQWLGLSTEPECTLIRQAIESPAKGAPARSESAEPPCWLEALWDEGEREEEGLPYAGQIRLLLEPLSPGDLEHIQHLRDALARREPATRRVVVATGERHRLERSIPSLMESDPDVLLHTLVPVCHVLLLGASELSRQVARLARQADFAVTVCEPRPAFARQWQEPEVPLHAGPRKR